MGGPMTTISVLAVLTGYHSKKSIKRKNKKMKE